MNRSRSISVSPDTHAIIKRYACFAGMSSKCAVEYAVNHCLVTEISDYLRDVDGSEAEIRCQIANLLLHEGWRFDLVAEAGGSLDALISLDFGFSDPVLVSPSEALTIQRCLENLPYSGGSFQFGGGRSVCLVKVSRQGQGIAFTPIDAATGARKGAKATIATACVPRVTMAFEEIISASRAFGEAV